MDSEFSEDKKGFAIPAAPGHSLRLLNDYMRTDLLRQLHLHIHQMKDNQEPGSPIHYLANGLERVLDSCEGVNRFECVAKNPYCIAPVYPFNAERDYLHDIKLMKHHLTCDRKTIKQLDGGAFSKYGL